MTYKRNGKSRQNAGIVMGAYRRGEMVRKESPHNTINYLQNPKLRALVGLTTPHKRCIKK